MAEDQGLDLRLERFLKQHSQLDKLSKRVLEINGQHELTRRMAAMAADEASGIEFDELARLLLDQARIVEGEPIPDPGRVLAADVELPGQGHRGLAAGCPAVEPSTLPGSLWGLLGWIAAHPESLLGSAVLVWVLSQIAASIRPCAPSNGAVCATPRWRCAPRSS